MKKLIMLSVSLFSISAFAITDVELNLIINQASVKTDLYFCFKAASGARLFDGEIIDQIITKNCDQNLVEARELNISDVEIENIAKRVFLENQKSEIDLAIEEAMK